VDVVPGLSTTALRRGDGLGTALAVPADMLAARFVVLSVVTAVMLVPSVARPCSLRQLPVGAEPFSTGSTVPNRLLDGGTDATPPAKPTAANLKVTLVKNPCNGSGASCPQFDVLEFTVASGDLETPVDRLRYLAAFGATAAEAATAEPSLLFAADPSTPTAVSAWLGLDGLRSGSGFDRASYCFTLAAVDDGANVSPRSDAVCVDTTSTTAPTTTVTQGTPCGALGCGCSTSSERSGALLALLALAWLGAARVRAPARAGTSSRTLRSRR
jgi:MYXO-CTERM domain-containing protein